MARSEGNRKFSMQKAALTRAVNSGDPAKVKAACKKAVAEWNDPNGVFAYNGRGAWPDDWARWQRALDDALGWRSEVTLEDL